MKDKSASRFVTRLSRIFQLKFWLDVGRLSAFKAYIITLFKTLFLLQPSAVTESFEAAKKRLHLTDEQILKQQHALFRMSLFMLILSSMILGYAIYQMVYGSILGMFLSLIVMLIAMALAFRYHFWFFQLKKKTLGCSWKTWLNEGVFGRKK